MSQFQLGISQSTMRVAALQLHKFFGTLSIAFALYRLIMKTFWVGWVRQKAEAWPENATNVYTNDSIKNFD